MDKRWIGIATIWLLLIAISSRSSNVLADVAAVNLSGGFLGPSQFNQAAGWSFHLNTEVTLATLGVCDTAQDGLGASHDVGVWTTSGTLVVSGTVPAGSAGILLGNFRYVDVADVVLPVGDYVIGAHFGQSNDEFGQDYTVVETHPLIDYLNRAGTGPGFVFPTIIAGSGGGNFFTSIFQFDLVPEPSSVALLGMGGLSMLGCVSRRRHENQSLTHREGSCK